MNPLTKLRSLLAFLRQGTSQQQFYSMLRQRHPSLLFREGFTIRNPEAFFPGPDNYFEHNVYINCGGDWSGGRGYFRSGRNCFIGANAVIYAAGGVELGDDVAMSPCCTIVSHQHGLFREKGLYLKQESLYAPVKVGSNVLILVGAIILKGVAIGDNAVVGASAVVTRDVPADSVVMGVPARVVRRN